LPDKSPPFSALRALEAASRHRSYTWAARELQVTHSAVSQSIRRLETELGTRLFERHGSGMEPSPAALELAQAYSNAADSLAQSMRRASHMQARNSLIIAMSPDFSRLWFAPRLEVLADALPDLVVEIRGYRGGPPPEDADIVIGVGHPSESGWLAEPMQRIAVLPVASPAFLIQHPQRNLRDVLSAPLLSARAMGWDAWLRGAGLRTFRTPASHVFDDVGMMLDAAARGHGLALTPLLLAQDHLRSGALAPAFERSVDTGESAFLARRADSVRAALIDRFAIWARRELGGDNAPEAPTASVLSSVD
jgi:DNA-binding transcriptional LysR family regulator